MCSAVQRNVIGITGRPSFFLLLLEIVIGGANVSQLFTRNPAANIYVPA